MFAVGDTVMHPSEGVCTVQDIRTMQFARQPREYYVLRPSLEKSSSTVYMPVERGDAMLRRLLSREDLVRLIRESASQPTLWVEDSRMRKDAFSKILAGGDYAQIIRMICELHKSREERAAEGKKPCVSDETLLAQAEQLVHQEFSYVMHMSLEETVEFIKRELETL